MVTKVDKQLLALERLWAKALYSEGCELIERLGDRLCILLSSEERQTLADNLGQMVSFDVFVTPCGDPQIDSIVSKANADPEANAILDDFLKLLERCKYVPVGDPSWLES